MMHALWVAGVHRSLVDRASQGKCHQQMTPAGLGQRKGEEQSRWREHMGEGEEEVKIDVTCIGSTN